MARPFSFVGIAGAVVAMTAGLALPAAATGTTVTSYSGMPAPLASFTSACSTSTPPTGTGTGSTQHQLGASVIGDGFLAVHTGTQPSLAGVTETFSGGLAAGSLTALSIRHSESANPSTSIFATPFLLLVMDRNGDGATHDTLYTSANPTGSSTSWAVLDGGTAQFLFNGSGSATYADYKNTFASAKLDAIYVGDKTPGCSGTTDYEGRIDGLYVEIDGTGTLYDFEAPHPTSLSNTVSRTALVYGNSVTVRTKLTSGGTAVAGQPVHLLAKKAGTSTYSSLTTVVTDSSGAVSSIQVPKVNTTYKWTFDGTDSLAATASTTKFVGVARRLTLAAADTTLTATQQLKVHGKETPRHVGSAVVVWRHNKSGTFKVGSTTVKSDGTWALAHAFPKGSWSVYATAPKDATHIASKTAAVAIKSA